MMMWSDAGWRRVRDHRPSYDDRRRRRACRACTPFVAERSFSIGDHDIAVTVSAGCASGIGEYPASLVRRADQALYESKLHGRNRVTCNSPHDVIGHVSPQMIQ